MVRALPSDLARLVLDYLNSEGLQNSYEIFLQESPHLLELRNFPSSGILPLGAKGLQIIVEEYYELISQDGSQLKSVNDALFKLWKRFDSLLVQIKHHYTGSGATTMLTRDVASQGVRSRYSLNHLRHERLLQEREKALHLARFTAIKQQEQQQQQQNFQQPQQQQNPQNPQRQQQQPPMQHTQQLLTSQRQQPMQHAQHPSTSQQQQLSQRQQLQQQERQPPSGHSPATFPNLASSAPQGHNPRPQPQQAQITTPLSSSLLTNQQQGGESCDIISSTPRPSLPTAAEEEVTASCSENVTSTQAHFLTPTKPSLADQQQPQERAIGKSPKRKSVPPRRKVTSASVREAACGLPSTGWNSQGAEDLPNLPSPWGSVVNNMELVEKLAENINKILPAQTSSSGNPSPEAPAQQPSTTTTTLPNQEPGCSRERLDDSQGSTASGQALEDILEGMMSTSMVDEFVDMTSNDPAFNSLFALFNTDKDKFLNSERKQLQLSASEDDLNSSLESQDGATAAPRSVQDVQPTAESLDVLVHDGIRTVTKEPLEGQVSNPQSECTPTSQHSSIQSQQDTSSTDGAPSMETSVKPTSNPFPNMVISKDSPHRRKPAVGPSKASSNPQTSTGITDNVQKPTRSLIVRSAVDTMPRAHVRELSFGSDASPVPVDRTHRKALPQDSPGCGNVQGSGSRDSSPHCSSNERTPSKRGVSMSPRRMYSPEEKAVARLLTKLPKTPTKTPTRTPAASPRRQTSLENKRVVVVKTKTAKSQKIRQPVGSSIGQTSQPHVVQAELERTFTDASQEAAVHVNGAKLTDMPGHSMPSDPQREKASARTDISNGSGVLVKEATCSSVVLDSVNSGSEARTPEAMGSRASTPDRGRTKRTTKGVKRERKDGDVTKVSKKAKQKKSTNKKSLNFPVDLDVDKFLSQIHY